MNGRPGRRLAALRVLAITAAAALAVTAAAADGPSVTNAWARATAPGIDVGAAYMTLEGGAKNDRLVAARSERATMVHLHTVEESGGVARMRPVEGIEVPAGRKVELAPKGMHIMLMGLASPLVAGESFPITLSFAKAGELVVEVAVRAAGDDHAGHAQH
jgi:copper(I)-binding protein